MARISSTPMSLESSMKIGAAASFSTARSTFGQRSALTRPLRSSSLDTLACEAMKRCASSVSDISSENRATGLPWSIAAFSAMLVASVLLPIEGRAASTIRLPGWKPPVRSSMSANPEGVPVRPMSERDSSSSLSISSWRTASIVRISAMPPSWPILKRAASARSIRSRGSPRWARTSAWMWRVVSRMPRMRASSRTMRA